MPSGLPDYLRAASWEVTALPEIDLVIFFRRLSDSFLKEAAQHSGKLPKTKAFRHLARSLHGFSRGQFCSMELGTNGAMNSIEQSRLLQMRSTIVGQNGALQRAIEHSSVTATEGTPNADFGSALSSALKAVNAQQAKATDMTNAYERGETHDIVSVMVERQKASLGFEATLQVRNKLLSAYRDIMNMPV